MSHQTQARLDQSTLSTYLNDHLAGSKAAIELVTSLRSETEGTPLGDLVGRLVIEIDEDRATLEGLMTRLGVEPHRVKQAAGWMTEKLSRVRFAERVTGSTATTRLMQLETLSVGIEGKRLLWTAMARLSQVVAVAQTVDYAGLVARAERQRDSLEPFRLDAAAEGFAA